MPSWVITLSAWVKFIRGPITGGFQIEPHRRLCRTCGRQGGGQAGSSRASEGVSAIHGGTPLYKGHSYSPSTPPDSAPIWQEIQAPLDHQ